MNTFDVTLDLDKRGLVQVVPIRQGDKSGTTIRATITDHGAAAATSGMTARFQMRLPDGTHYYRKAASLSGNVATVALDEAQAASVAGRTDVAYFQLLQGSTVVASTESFTVVVLPDALADAEVAESYDSAIQDAIDALDSAVEQMPDMVEDVLADHPEWTTTVQDGSITAPKLATDLARDRERLLYRLANMLTAQLPEGDVATATDAAKTPVAGLALYGRSTQDGTPTPSAPVPIVSVAPDSQGNISLWARGRNLVGDLTAIKARGVHGTWSGNTYTDNSVSFAFGEDGSITANGTSTGLSIIQLAQSDFLLPAGTYQLSGCPAGGGTTTYRLDVERVGASVFATDNGGGVTFTLDTDTNINVRLRVPSGAALANKVFWPMLRLASTGAEFVPYTATVTPIDLDGHELRSLPDGTRDEVNVDERGHAVLVQRVGSVTLDGSESGWEQKATNTSGKYRYSFPCGLPDGTSLGEKVVSNWTLCDRFTNASDAGPNDGTYTCHTGVSARRTASGEVIFFHTGETLANWKTWLASNPATLDYKLATPIAHDLGYVAAVPLVGPDLTAQAVPTAPMQLTYELDLNATLARLESALATLA